MEEVASLETSLAKIHILCLKIHAWERIWAVTRESAFRLRQGKILGEIFLHSPSIFGEKAATTGKWSVGEQSRSEEECSLFIPDHTCVYPQYGIYAME